MYKKQIEPDKLIELVDLIDDSLEKGIAMISILAISNITQIDNMLLQVYLNELTQTLATARTSWEEVSNTILSYL